jgi:hypothetical protein
VQAAKPTTSIQIDTLKPQQATPKQPVVEFSPKFQLIIPPQIPDEKFLYQFNDKEFIAAFESCNPSLFEKWNHVSFLRIVWLYLTTYGELFEVLNVPLTLCRKKRRSEEDNG